MAFILREYRCSACGHVWEALLPAGQMPIECPAPPPEPGAQHVDEYSIHRVIGVPAYGKHSSWQAWQK